jgi:elongation factor P--beta-lysine ligase
MKRLLAAGYDKLFQFSRCFRKGERGRWHNPEFTMLELYSAYADYEEMMRLAEELISFVAKDLLGKETEQQLTPAYWEEQEKTNVKKYPTLCG